MRKRIIGLITLIVCLSLSLHVALAEEVRVSVTPTPAELSEAGTVKFTFAISNFSDYELSDIVIVYNGASYEDLMGLVVPPSQSIPNFELELPVSDSQLGNPIVFTLTCVRNGEPITTEATTTIARSADPVVSLTRTADATMVRQGDKVKLTYSLKNDTVFDMTDITVIDEEVSDTPLKQGQLRRGGSFSWDWELTMGKDDVLSHPIVTYTVNGKTKSFSGVEAMPLTALLVQLEMKVDAGTPTAAGVNFTLDIKNTGNQDISGITIKDERGNAVVDTAFSLKAGDSATHSYLVVPVMTEAVRNVKFYLEGTDAIGQAYKLESSDSYPVYPLVDDTQISVTMVSETVTPWTAESGKVVARVKIENRSSVTLSNVSVLETGNVVKTYDTLQSGETSFDTEIILGSPRNLQFTLKGTDPTGTARELAASALPVAYGTESAPEATSEQIEPSGNMQAFSFLSSTISKILVGLGALMVISFIVLIVLSIMERSRMNDLRLDDEDDDEDEDEFDSFFDERKPLSPKIDYDDREETESYTRKISRTARQHAVEPAPIPLPAAKREEYAPVEIEFDEPAYEERTPPRRSARPPEAPQKHVYEPRPSDSARRAAPPMRDPFEEEIEDADFPPFFAAAAEREPELPPYEDRKHAYVTSRTRMEQMRAERETTARRTRPIVDESAELPYDVEDFREHETYGTRTPKVMQTKARPSVQPVKRTEIRHVRPLPKKK